MLTLLPCGFSRRPEAFANWVAGPEQPQRRRAGELQHCRRLWQQGCNQLGLNNAGTPGVSAVVEPQLWGGSPADTTVRFESQQQVLDAMNKRNDRGQRMYDVDEAYRNKVQMILAASDVF